MFDSDLKDFKPFARIGLQLARDVSANYFNYGDSITCLQLKQERLQQAVFAILAELVQMEERNV